MSSLLYWCVDIIAKIHNKILTLNDSYEGIFNDKQLHFLVIGFIGMLMIFVIYPLFKALSKKHVLVIAWIYVFTLIIVITFAIEIGQKMTNTGNMEFADIVFGVAGFMVFFAIFYVIRLFILAIYNLFKNEDDDEEED